VCAELIHFVSVVWAFLFGVFSCLAFNQSMIGFQPLFRFDEFYLRGNLAFVLVAYSPSMIFLLLTVPVFSTCFVSFCLRSSALIGSYEQAIFFQSPCHFPYFLLMTPWENGRLNLRTSAQGAPVFPTLTTCSAVLQFS
jgi:uncharacterized membrane protein